MNAPPLRAALARNLTPVTAAPRLRALATAVPKHVLPQDQVRATAKAYYGPRTGTFEHLEPVFANAQIDTRYACQPFDWYLKPHDFGEKSALYTEHALALALGVAIKTLADAGLPRFGLLLPAHENGRAILRSFSRTLAILARRRGTLFLRDADPVVWSAVDGAVLDLWTPATPPGRMP